MAWRFGRGGGRRWLLMTIIAVLIYPGFGYGGPEDGGVEKLLAVEAWLTGGSSEAAVEAGRKAFAAEPSAENHRSYVQALLGAGEEGELLAHLEERADELSSEADFWRSLLPEIQRHGVLEAAAAILEEAWERGKEDARVLFALAELRIFQGRMEEARGMFWAVFEMRELARPEDGMSYFRRLNHFFHNRFAVKNRLGQATGRYGTEGCREFSFLGLRADLVIADVGAARDGALLYLRELLFPDGSSGEFLQRLRAGLDREYRPPGQRILAFAGVGAPAWMLEEVEAFVRAPGEDSAAAEFSLLAMNRFVLSTKKFPELRPQMGHLARALEGKFKAGRPLEVRRRNEEMRERILSRLGFDEDRGGAAEGSREEVFARMADAVEAGDPAKAEELYREFSHRSGENEPGVLLFLARAWLAGNDPEQAAARVAEFLEPLYRSSTDEVVPAPLEWTEGAGFPPVNPYFGEMEMEALRAAFETVVNTPAWELLMEKLVRRDDTLPRTSRAPACVARTILHWWAEERDQAIAAARFGAERLGVLEVQLLLAHLLGVEGRLEEGQALLEEIAAATVDGGDDRPRRLLFAFAVAAGEPEEAGERAVALEDSVVAAEEKVEVAAGLSSVGLEEYAADWLEEVQLDELGARQAEVYQQVRLKVLVARQDQQGAEAQARQILQGALPSSFHDLMTPVRREALEVLAGSGGMESYQRQLRGLAAVAPRAWPLDLLLGESADFLWMKERAAGATEVGDACREAIRSYRRAVAARPGSVDLQLELCEWLAGRELWEEAVTEYRKLLELDAQAALLDTGVLFNAFRQTGHLPFLVEFLEEWRAPEAVSMDDFYGLQPTAHIFEPLGEMLLEEGEREHAIRAWRKGLEINPIGFTEQIRVALAEAYRAGGKEAEVLALVKEYVDRPNPDPHFYAIQPFASVAPRWIVSLNASSDQSASAIERLIATAEEGGSGMELRSAAEIWHQERPERLSPAAFRVYLSARAGRPDWTWQLDDLEEKFAVETGPLSGGWEAVEEVMTSLQ